MIVLKIGGSSVDSAAAIERTVELVRGFHERRPVVVVSAMAKTTNRLLESAEAAAAGDSRRAEAIYADLLDFHCREGTKAVPAAARAPLEGAIAAFFAELRSRLAAIEAAGVLTPRDADAVAACGELAASTILAAALTHAGLDAPWIDCRQVIVTDDEHTRAHPLYEPTDARLREQLPPHLEAGRIPVLGGYVGATAEGVPTTLGKEGSDFSAAIVGAALQADEIVICTDVEGILTADPRLYPAARRVRTLSFAETLELACSGGKKPHFGTLGPAARADVPLRIVSSRSPQSTGTVVGRRMTPAQPTIKSIACRTNACLLTLTSSRLADGESILRRLAAPFERFRPALILLELEVGRVTFGLDREERLEEVRTSLLASLGQGAEISTSPGRGVISLISEDLATQPAFAARILEVLGNRDVRLLTRGVAAPVLRILSEEGDDAELAGVVADLHPRLFPGPPDEEVP